jgi:hypothetical protein
MFIISVLAQGKIKEVILPNAGQTAVKTYRYDLMTWRGACGLAPTGDQARLTSLMRPKRPSS